MTATMTSTRSSLSFPEPRFGTPRRPDRPTFGHRLAKIAEVLGQPLMPWQRHIADVGCEYDPETGAPLYRDVFVTVPRQHGKTTLFLMWMLDRCLNWGAPQRMVFTAQDGSKARKKWVEELFPLIEHSRLEALVERKTRSAADTGIKFKTGSIISVGQSSESEGHGLSLHMAVMDEIWKDEDDRREQGLRPTMLTVPDAQILVCSTAGTNASTVYNRKVAEGREKAAADVGTGWAYFEWSATDDWDPADEDSYYDFMPALCPDSPCRCDPDGRWRHTITMDVVRAERDSGMEPAEFRRAYGNRPTGGADMIVPPDVWRRVCDETAKPSGQVNFGLDVAADRGSASLVAYGGGVVEMVRHDLGLDWVVEAANEACSRTGGKVALDFGGPAGVLADQLDSPMKLKGREVIQACGAMFDLIVEDRIKFRASTAVSDVFTAAMEGAVKKPVADQWVWSRKASTADVTPLMAATVAAVDAPPALTPIAFYG